MVINVDHSIYVAVTQLALDILRIFTLGNQKAGVGVPEVMKSDWRQTGPLEGREELFTDVFYSIFACGLS